MSKTVKNRVFWAIKEDSIIVLILLLLGLVFWLLSLESAKYKKNYKITRYESQRILEQSLEPDFEGGLSIEGRLGKMVVEFDRYNGARVASSACSCQVCVNSGWSRSEPIICVPNAVMIQPKTFNEGKSVDATTR